MRIVFDFYRGYSHQVLLIEELEKNQSNSKSSYFLINRGQRNQLQEKGFKVEPLISLKDYNVAKVSLKFLIAFLQRYRRGSVA